MLGRSFQMSAALQTTTIHEVVQTLSICRSRCAYAFPVIPSTLRGHDLNVPAQREHGQVVLQPKHPFHHPESLGSVARQADCLHFICVFHIHMHRRNPPKICRSDPPSEQSQDSDRTWHRVVDLALFRQLRAMGNRFVPRR